jgi:hypothetical protein
MAHDMVDAVVRWEPCDAFTPADDGAPVCSCCGWLDAEHEDAHQEDAPVTALRLAS